MRARDETTDGPSDDGVARARALSPDLLATDDLAAALTAVVKQSEGAYAAFLHDTERLVQAEFPELSAVPEVADQFGRMCIAHARAMGDLLAEPAFDNLDQMASGATKFARDCAHWEIPVTTIIRILQRGLELSWSWWILRIEETTSDPQLCAAMSVRCGRLLMTYTSSAVELVVVVHEAERQSRTRGVSWRQHQAVSEVLAGRDAGHVSDLSLEVGHEFGAWQIGFVAWTDGDENDQVRLVTDVRGWAADVTRSVPLLIPGEGGSVWGWTASAAFPKWAGTRLPTPPNGARIALGQPAHGLDGFRESHAEAILVYELALRTRPGAALLHHSDLAPLALLTPDTTQLRRFVSRILGTLSEDSTRAQRLRETVRSYLAHGENAREVADEMHFHRNTIHGRLELAAQLRGRGLDEDRVALGLALEIAEVYGSAVLTPPSSPLHLDDSS